MDFEDAENLAVELIKREFKDVPANEREDPPVLYIDKIEELESFKDFDVPGKGAVWYPEDE